MSVRNMPRLLCNPGFSVGTIWKSFGALELGVLAVTVAVV
jgi:hypothetical protein